MMNNVCMNEYYWRLINWIYLIYIFGFFLKCVIKLVNYVNNCCIFGNEFIIKFNFFVFCWS